MYFLIVGGGEIGSNLAEYLIAAGEEVLILELGALRVENLRHRLGHVVLEGDGTRHAVLESIGCARTDILIATTRNDASNLAACQLAKYMFKVPRTVAIVNSQENVPLFRASGIDNVVSIVDLVFSNLQNVIPALPVTSLMPVHNGKYEIVGIKLPAGGTTAGLTVSDLKLPSNSKILAIIPPNDSPISVTPTAEIPRESSILTLVPSSEVAQIRALLVGETVTNA